MAKSEVLSTKELKKELHRMVTEILDEDDYCAETTNKALKTLFALRDSKFKRQLSFGNDNLSLPDEFRCPLSGELMKDPVILSTGETYDRVFIEKWLNDGHRTCPRTKQVLSHTLLTPNYLARELISHWCKGHGINLPKPVQDSDDELTTVEEKDHLNSLLENMSSSLDDQKKAAKELCRLTKRMPSFRALFGESTNIIPQLLNPLMDTASDPDPDPDLDLQEDLITTVLNLSIHENNKKLVAESPVVIPLLIESLKFGTIETRRSAAAALFTLSSLESNKNIIGNSGAIKPLIDLLEEGHPLAMQDAASAIFSLCIVVENRARAVYAGAVRVILKKIKECILVDELLGILAMLSSQELGAEEMLELEAVPLLLSIIREDTSKRCKENSAAMLLTLCFNNRNKLWEIKEEEEVNGTISKLEQTGTLRAKRKAHGILERVNIYF